MKKLTGVTKSGFTYSILETNPLALPRVMNLLLGKEQAQKLKDHLRDEDGVVDTEQITSELKNIFESQKRLKN